MRTSYSNKAQKRAGRYIKGARLRKQDGMEKRHDIAQEPNTHRIVSYTRAINGVGKPGGEGAAAERQATTERREVRIAENTAGAESIHIHASQRGDNTIDGMGGPCTADVKASSTAVYAPPPPPPPPPALFLTSLSEISWMLVPLDCVALVA